MRKFKTFITETLSPSQGAEAYIHDFVHSKNKHFKGKSKKQRIKMALGAYYGARNESHEDAAETTVVPAGYVPPVMSYNDMAHRKNGKKRTTKGIDLQLKWLKKRTKQ